VTRWWRALAFTAAGSVVFGLSVANGHGLELVWLPAVLLGASWPSASTGSIRSCLRRLREKGARA
jgi:hypothetical protein